MKVSEALQLLMKNEDMIGKTFHFRMPVSHFKRVLTSWTLLMNKRPSIQLRDVKGAKTQFVEAFVLSVTLEDNQQAEWARMLMDLPDTQTVQKG